MILSSAYTVGAQQSWSACDEPLLHADSGLPLAVIKSFQSKMQMICQVCSDNCEALLQRYLGHLLSVADLRDSSCRLTTNKYNTVDCQRPPRYSYG